MKHAEINIFHLHNKTTKTEVADQLSISSSYSTLTPGQPVPALTL